MHSNIFINVYIFPFLLFSSQFHLMIKQSVFRAPPSKTNYFLSFSPTQFFFLPSPRYIACQHWIPNKHTRVSHLYPHLKLILFACFLRKGCIQTATFTINSSIFLLSHKTNIIIFIIITILFFFFNMGGLSSRVWVNEVVFVFLFIHALMIIVFILIFSLYLHLKNRIKKLSC